MDESSQADSRRNWTLYDWTSPILRSSQLDFDLLKGPLVDLHAFNDPRVRLTEAFMRYAHTGLSNAD
jgi:hypothetical protein